MREPGATPIEQREDVTRTGSTSYSMEPVRPPLAARKRGGSRRLCSKLLAKFSCTGGHPRRRELLVAIGE
jgi:hypothetical protein